MQFRKTERKVRTYNTFSLLTWNVLVAELVDAFPRADKRIFAWEYRK
jgi:hypothetical protein